MAFFYLFFFMSGFWLLDVHTTTTLPAFSSSSAWMTLRTIVQCRPNCDSISPQLRELKSIEIRESSAPTWLVICIAFCLFFKVLT